MESRLDYRHNLGYPKARKEQWMTDPFWQGADGLSLYLGDCREVMRALPGMEM